MLDNASRHYSNLITVYTKLSKSSELAKENTSCHFEQ